MTLPFFGSETATQCFGFGDVFGPAFGGEVRLCGVSDKFRQEMKDRPMSCCSLLRLRSVNSV